MSWLKWCLCINWTWVSGPPWPSLGPPLIKLQIQSLQEVSIKNRLTIQRNQNEKAPRSWCCLLIKTSHYHASESCRVKFFFCQKINLSSIFGANFQNPKTESLAFGSSVQIFCFQISFRCHFIVTGPPSEPEQTFTGVKEGSVFPPSFRTFLIFLEILEWLLSSASSLGGDKLMWKLQIFNNPAVFKDSFFFFFCLHSQEVRKSLVIPSLFI